MSKSFETDRADMAGFALTLMTSRQSILPKRLSEPGPNPQQVNDLFVAAAAAPDHGMLTPWRFVLVPPDKRHVLAEVFAKALLQRDATASVEQLSQAREKAFRAPFLALAIACLGPREPNIAPLERLVSLGAAVQNILLCAHGMGFGSSLTSGQAMQSPGLHQLFSLAQDEQAVCFVNVGTVTKRKPARIHPAVASFVTQL